MLNRLLRASPYIVVQLAAMVLYQVAGRIDFPAAPGRIGPDFWPKSILVLLGLVCVYEIIKNLLIGETFTAAGLLEKFMKDSGATEGEEKLRSYPLILAYLALFMVIGRYRNWTVIAVSSVLGSLALVFIFMKVVYVSLPLGVEPFSAVSLWLLRVMGVP